MNGCHCQYSIRQAWLQLSVLVVCDHHYDCVTGYMHVFLFVKRSGDGHSYV